MLPGKLSCQGSPCAEFVIAQSSPVEEATLGCVGGNPYFNSAICDIWQEGSKLRGRKQYYI